MKAFNNGGAITLAENDSLDAKLFPPNSDMIEGRELLKVSAGL